MQGEESRGVRWVEQGEGGMNDNSGAAGGGDVGEKVPGGREEVVGKGVLGSEQCGKGLPDSRSPRGRASTGKRGWKSWRQMKPRQ